MSHDSSHERAVAVSRAEIAQLHEFEHWPAKRLWPLIFATIGLTLAAVAVPPAHWPGLLVIWPALGTVIFVFVIAFHDASHNRLHPVYWINEAFGHIVGTLSFVPLNVYRYAHARHHAYLATPADPELWPFNSPGIGRFHRVLAAFCEIVFGFIYSPLLFLRAVLVGEKTPRERKLIVRGYVACIVVWTIILGVCDYLGDWWLLLVTGIVPMAISAFMQTINKFTQHLGLHGKTVLGLTRTVIDEHPAGAVVSSTMFYNDYHGTHHRYAKIPYYNLPAATPYTLANASEFCPVYSNLAWAMLAMIPCLADPKVGPQWLDGGDWRERKKATRETTEHVSSDVTV
jgi:fatty acid desaturase